MASSFCIHPRHFPPLVRLRRVEEPLRRLDIMVKFAERAIASAEIMADQAKIGTALDGGCGGLQVC